MTVLLIIFFLLTIITEKIIYNLKNPIFYVWLWWMGWLILANLNSNIEISLETNIFFFVNIMLFYILSIFFRKIKIVIPKTGNFLDKKINLFLIRIEKFKYIFFITNIICVLYLLRFLSKNNVSYSEYRDLLFINENLSFEIFGNILRRFLFYSNIFFLCFFSKGILDFIKEKKINSLFYLFNLILLDLINGSRSYTFIFTVVFVILLICLNVNFKKIFLIFLSLGGAVTTLSLFRMKELGLLKILKVNIFYYHTIPFALFNREFLDKNALLNTIDGKGSATGGLFFIILGKILNIYYPLELQRILTKNFMEFVNIGIKEKFYYNAFYTIFYNFYIDGGLFFSLFMICLYSFIFSKSWVVYLYKKNFLSLLYVYGLLLIGLTSIYFSVTYTYYWYIMIILFLLNFYKVIYIPLNSTKIKE